MRSQFVAFCTGQARRKFTSGGKNINQSNKSDQCEQLNKINDKFLDVHGKLGDVQGKIGDVHGKLGEHSSILSETVRKITADAVRGMQNFYAILFTGFICSVGAFYAYHNLMVILLLICLESWAYGQE